VCPCKLELERDVGPVRAYELGCASEQRGSGPVVLAVDRAVAGGREPGGGAVGEAGVGLPELCVIPAKVGGGGLAAALIPVPKALYLRSWNTPARHYSHLRRDARCLTS
jgi:hypothetical protein